MPCARGIIDWIASNPSAAAASADAAAVRPHCTATASTHLKPRGRLIAQEGINFTLHNHCVNGTMIVFNASFLEVEMRIRLYDCFLMHDPMAGCWHGGGGGGWWLAYRGTVLLFWLNVLFYKQVSLSRHSFLLVYYLNQFSAESPELYPVTCKSSVLSRVHISTLTPVRVNSILEHRWSYAEILTHIWSIHYITPYWASELRLLLLAQLQHVLLLQIPSTSLCDWLRFHGNLPGMN